MFNKLAAIGTVYENYMIKRGRIEARKILLKQDAKTLLDIGIDRTELLGGIKNWPWNGSTVQRATVKTVELKQVNKAMTELSNYTDRELQDIGINRGMIADAVANGRQGIDNNQTPLRPLNTGGDRQAA